MTDAGLLHGVRVLDFGRYIAGPYCAAMLGDLGADVIRIERPGGGEDRALLPLSDAADGGALFVQVNRNKRGMTLDPRSEDGRGVLQRIVASADVVVANLPGAALTRLGLDYGTIRKIREDIVLTTISAFGESGPWAERPGFDGVGQVMSGAAHLSGEPDVPSKSHALWVDFATAGFSAFATLAALTERTTSGQGQHVRGSLLGSALTVGNSTLIEESALGLDRVASGNRAQVAGPADIYATQNGWVIVQVVGRPMFERWANAVNRPDLLSDDSLLTDQQRGDARDVLAEVMAPWCAAGPTELVLSTLAAAGVPCGPVLTPHAALTHPQIVAGGWLAPIAYPGVTAPLPITTTPVDLPRGKRARTDRAPLLGEHTGEVLGDLGYGDAEIAALRARGTI